MGQLEVSEISLNFGAVRALDRIGLAVQPGEIVSIIGPNGAGKTSLLNVISRIYRPSSFRKRPATHPFWPLYSTSHQRERAARSFWTSVMRFHCSNVTWLGQP